MEQPSLQSYTSMWDGKDRVIRGALTSHFGDVKDTQDNGVGAWGFNYRERPDFPGIALPSGTIIFLGLAQYHPVKVFDPASNKTLHCFLIDKGPAKSTKRDADLLIMPWEFFGFVAYGPDDPGAVRLDLRIILPPHGPVE